MPALADDVVKDVTFRLGAYLVAKSGYSSPQYLTSGGSAAIFKVEGEAGPRAFKVFDPKFFEGKSGVAERRRLEVQRRLIAHQCHSLIQTFNVEEAQGTAFMEMEFIPWSDLNKALKDIPDDEVASLIKQLVEAVRFLEDQGIVHRDIKPENIKVSPDFKALKLLDLGVARNLDSPDDADAAITDHGNTRPFLATAQYSSPEYLFRLDEPSPKLWKGLSLYQVGAVLHDLIMKKQLFDFEMEAGNRWLVSKAVLTKIPSFFDGEANRLPELKALAARCLNKDLDLRLQTVGWDDFTIDGAKDPLNALRGRLVKGGRGLGTQAKAAVEGRLEFERRAHIKRFMDRVRDNLVTACGTQLPPSFSPSADRLSYNCTFAPNDMLIIRCQINFVWKEEIYSKHADIFISALMYNAKLADEVQLPNFVGLCSISLDGNDETSISDVSATIAKAVSGALNMLDTMATEEELAVHDLTNTL